MRHCTCVTMFCLYLSIHETLHMRYYVLTTYHAFLHKDSNKYTRWQFHKHHMTKSHENKENIFTTSKNYPHYFNHNMSTPLESIWRLPKYVLIRGRHNYVTRNTAEGKLYNSHTLQMYLTCSLDCTSYTMCTCRIKNYTYYTMQEYKLTHSPKTAS